MNLGVINMAEKGSKIRSIQFVVANQWSIKNWILLLIDFPFFKNSPFL
jgi:lysophospholipid acyltransferase (LPLAT)-like uncharacterized protein